MGNTFGRLFSHKESLATSPFMNQRLSKQRIGTANFSHTPKPNTTTNSGLGRGNTAAQSFNKSQSYFDFNPDPKSNLYIFTNSIVDTIGNIWKCSEKIRKDNKKFKRL
jgi:hypothetical protein